MLPLVSHGEYPDGQTNRQTDGRQTVTLRFPLGAAGITSTNSAFLHISPLLTYQSPTFSTLVISTLALSLFAQFSVPLPQSMDFLSRTRP